MKKFYYFKLIYNWWNIHSNDAVVSFLSKFNTFSELNHLYTEEKKTHSYLTILIMVWLAY